MAVRKKKPAKKKPAKKKPAAKVPPGFNSRIKELRTVPSSELIANPKNWRTHDEGQKAAVRGLLQEVGIVDALIARETPAGLQLIDGHLRQELASEQAWPVLVLDVDEVEADLLLASLDPLAAMAGQDDKILVDLLGDLSVEDEALGKALSGLVDVEDFAPALDPQQADTEVTPGEVEKADGELSTQFEDDETDDLETIVCPHCRQEFSVPKE